MAITYTTWNPDDKHADITLSNADLTATKIAASYANVRSILGVDSGRWYWEISFDDEGPQYNIEAFGVGDSAITLGAAVGYYSTGYVYREDGQKGNNNSYVAFGSIFNVGDIISVALDLNNGKIWWALNGVWQASGDPVAGTNEAYSGISGVNYAWVTLYDNTSTITVNFGASAFTYSVPSGFNAGFYSGTEDPNYYISGYVKERITPVNRQIYLHNRDTGALITSTTSSGVDGYFYCETTHSGSHYVVCLDNEIGADYNDLIYGKIFPAAIPG